MNLSASVNIVRRVGSFYRRKNFRSLADEHGNLADILTANAMTESLGTVPTPFSREELENIFQGSKAAAPGTALSEVVDYIISGARYLVRKEPGYTDPVSTPNKISVGAHHMLLSTAIETIGPPAPAGDAKTDTITRLIIDLASDSVFAAEMALRYFSKRYAKHLLEPPLMAAVYNAGSLKPSAKNPWNLVQYGEHIDRWVAYYNTSRSIALEQPA